MKDGPPPEHGTEPLVGVVSSFSGGLVSPMSVGDCSLTGRRDDVLYLIVTAKTDGPTII
jgi:hypothetical protein